MTKVGALLTADDFGWTDGHNLAVERAARAGRLHRASLLCNGAAFDGAIDVARRVPRLRLGVHLTALEGRPLLAPHSVGSLCDAEGSFPRSPAALLALWLRGALDVDALRREWSAQVQRALDAGLRPTHLDGHRHVHLLPPLLDVTVELALRYRIGWVRVPLEDVGRVALRRGPPGLALLALARRARSVLRAAGLACASHFEGLADSGSMTSTRLLAALRRAASRPGLTEVMVHPAVRTPELERTLAPFAWSKRYDFEGELAALLSPEVGEILDGRSRSIAR